MAERKFYSEREKNLLIHLVDSHKHIIETKKTDGVNIRKKQEAWQNIESLFNANDVTKRNSKQLKKLWDNIKQKTRKSDTEKKRHMLATGGGPPLGDDADPIEERVRSIVPTINYEIDNQFDSIHIFQNERNSLDLPSVSGCNKNEPESEPVNKECVKDVGEIEEECKENSTPCRPKLGAKRKFVNTLKNTKRQLIDEEAQLRRQKLKESILQQKELHKVKMEAAEEEKKYWSVKTLLLKKECQCNF